MLAQKDIYYCRYRNNLPAVINPRDRINVINKYGVLKRAESININKHTKDVYCLLLKLLVSYNSLYKINQGEIVLIVIIIYNHYRMGFKVVIQ